MILEGTGHNFRQGLAAFAGLAAAEDADNPDSSPVVSQNNKPEDGHPPPAVPSGNVKTVKVTPAEQAKKEVAVLTEKANLETLLGAAKAFYEEVLADNPNGKLVSWEEFSEDAPKTAKDFPEWSGKFEELKIYFKDGMNGMFAPYLKHLKAFYAGGVDAANDPCKGNNWMYWVGGAALLYWLVNK
jgi:hypothetical protein